MGQKEYMFSSWGFLIEDIEIILYDYRGVFYFIPHLLLYSIHITKKKLYKISCRPMNESSSLKWSE